MNTPLPNYPFWDEINAYVASEMAAQQIPALSLAMLQLGKLLFAREPTVYGLASISKTFAATALMLLVADGQCRLDDGIRLYLPEAPASWNPITLRHLLAHASGLPFQVRFEQYCACEKFLYRLDVTQEEFLRTAVQTPLDFAPGTQTRYSNTGYFLLGIAIERVSATSYFQWLSILKKSAGGCISAKCKWFSFVIQITPPGRSFQLMCWVNGRMNFLKRPSLVDEVYLAFADGMMSAISLSKELLFTAWNKQSRRT